MNALPRQGLAIIIAALLVLYAENAAAQEDVQAGTGSPAALTIIEEPPPIVETQPEASVTLSVVLGGVNGTAHYAWMLDKGGKSPVPVGPDTPDLRIAPVSMDDAGIYTCEIADDLNVAVTSPALLVVTPGISVTGNLGLALLAGGIALASTRLRRVRR